MPDIMGIVGNVLGGFKRLREVAEKIKDADLKNAIADLHLSLAEMKEQCAGLREENARLREQLARAESASDHDTEVECRDGAYFLKTPKMGRANGPFCVNCRDMRRSLVLMQTLPDALSDFGRYMCPECKGHFGPTA